ncbi:N-acetylmuramoyl-L-alanine amidase [Enterococcus dispar]|uniref:N-acetylmuramoyl-L-alanine amidase n=1 Tax=Enterococcus dispar TaxID=44009 RepID=UPI00189E30D8|nr:N-acetylmuramoyl-L-alanine amidase [Enterococcus dispar]
MKTKTKLGFMILVISIAGIGMLVWHSEPKSDAIKQPVQKTAQSSFLKIEQPDPLTVASKKVQVYVDPALYSTEAQTANDYVSLKKSPAEKSETVVKLYRGEWGLYLASQDDWIQINTNEGQIGWLKKENTKIVTSSRKVNPTLAQFKVVLDAGHGGMDTGAESDDGTLIEKELTLQTVKKVGSALEKLGVSVAYTRTQDKYLDLSTIADKAMAENADLFISIHYDKYDYDNGMDGQTTYYYYQDDRTVATILNSTLAKNLNLNNNGIRVGNYFVLRQSNRPSILLELGYLNSDKDLVIMKQTDFQDKVASEIAEGVRAYVASLTK